MSNNVLFLLISVAMVAIAGYFLYRVSRSKSPIVTEKTVADRVEDAVDLIRDGIDTKQREEVLKLYADYVEATAEVTRHTQLYIDNNPEMGKTAVTLFNDCSTVFSGRDICKLGPFTFDASIRSDTCRDLEITKGRAVIKLNTWGLGEFSLVVTAEHPHLRYVATKCTLEDLEKSYTQLDRPSTDVAASVSHYLSDIKNTIDAHVKAIETFCIMPKYPNIYDFHKHISDLFVFVDGPSKYCFDGYVFGQKLAEARVTFDDLKAANHAKLFTIRATDQNDAFTYEILVSTPEGLVTVINTFANDPSVYGPIWQRLPLPVVLEYQNETRRLLCLAENIARWRLNSSRY